MNTLRSVVLLAAIASTVVACDKAKKDAPTPPAEGNKPAAALTPQAPAKPAQPATVSVDLKPLPLQIDVPKGGMGAMDMSMGDHKSVTVDVGGGQSVNISEMKEKNVDALKKTYQGDTILQPFKKFTRNEATRFTIEIEATGKKQGFVAVTVLELGGKKYQCKSTGMDGQPTAAEAEANIAACATLKAKS